MPLYTVDSSQSRIEVRARSRIHDTTSVFDSIRGSVEAAPETLRENGARASFTVDMGSFDAGDWLKNKKLASEIDPKRYPTATFELARLERISDRDHGGFEVAARGRLRYRNHTLEIEISGTGTMDVEGIEARGHFDLDLRDLGMKPPRFLMFKMDPELTIDVFLRATT